MLRYWAASMTATRIMKEKINIRFMLWKTIVLIGNHLLRGVGLVGKLRMILLLPYQNIVQSWKLGSLRLKVAMFLHSDYHGHDRVGLTQQLPGCISNFIAWAMMFLALW